MTFGFEIGIGDIEPTVTEPVYAQAHLSAEVSAGDPLELRLDHLKSTLTVPVYTVFHNGTPIAQTARCFGEDLAARIGTLTVRKATWPTMAGARVESVATVVVDPVLGPAGRHGLRLAPVITGLLDIDWKGKKSDG